MKEAALPALRRQIGDIAAASALAGKVRRISIEPGEAPDGGRFLRIILGVRDSENLRWRDVEPLIRAIEDAVAEVDERVPSVRFADAA